MPLVHLPFVHDPTRIPGVIQALQRAWEGQPDLTLAQLVGVLQNRGMGWATTDPEALELLRSLESKHPSLIDASPSSHILITTTAPDNLVTLTDGHVVVRSAADPGRMPALWPFSTARRIGPGLPLIITDEEGIDHRLGVTTLVSRVDASSAPALRNLRRSETGGARWLVELADGARAVVGQRIRTWEPRGRRDVLQQVLAWEAISSCAPGEEFAFTRAGGAPPVHLGRVERVLLLEV